MKFQWERDVRDLTSALRSAPAVAATAVWGDGNGQVVGDLSYQLVGDGLILGLQDFRLLQPSDVRLIRRDYLTIQYTQAGAYRLCDDGQIWQVRSGSVRLNAMPDSIAAFSRATSLRGASILVEWARLVEQFGLRADLWREVYGVDVSAEGRVPFSLEVALTPEMWLILDAINNCTFEEPMRSVYLSAKTTELLTLTVVQLNALGHSGTTSGLGRAARDQRLIEAAALIYRQELARPPSISELSRRIGLNRNKLTGGFQAAFGLTPAEYARQVRLHWAARRLSEGLDVGQVASEVGYDSVAAFGRAFRQQFGHAPGRVEGRVHPPRGLAG